MKKITLLFAVMTLVCLGFMRIERNENIAVEDLKLTLPAGFKTTVVTEELGQNRHIAVHPNGDVYVKLAQLKDGKGILVLRDVKKDGNYSVVNSFGNYTGTGIAVKGKYLYASSDDAVYRYTFNNKNEIVNADKPDVIVKELVSQRQHAAKSITLDNAGNLYVNIGAPSNACQEQDRTRGSPGQDPCPILEKAGGIWQFKADKLNQSYNEGFRYVTGIRNIVGLDWHPVVNELYAVQHGRDMLSQLYPEMFSDEQNAEIPAEEMFLMKKGSDFGWPYCYYDPIQKKKLLAPEYGGDGKQEGRCESAGKPIVAFPGHWAPNAVLIYTGNAFPAKYKNGAFIAFHGSWNRAPKEQKGYKVVFVPLKNGLPDGDWEVFAEGFAGVDEIISPGDAMHRPCGLAQGPDGSLYISDSVKGKIWRVTHSKK